MVAGEVGYFTSRTCFRPLCAHLWMKLFVRRMQELLLPEQAAAVYAVSGLCAAINGLWNLPRPARAHTIMPKRSLKLIKHTAQHT